MTDFTFHNPTRIIFGRDRVGEIGGIARQLGQRVLLVYGKGSIKRSGLYDRVLQSLRAQGAQVVEHGGVKSNPVLSHVRAGVQKAKSEGIECILAVGGGSVIDESKAIAAGALTELDVWRFFTGEATIERALPLATILTIPATGSEMNGGLVVTNEQTMDKVGFSSDKLHPRVSIMDPSLTFSIPPDYTAYSAVDAISHVIEGYFTHGESWAPIQDGYVEVLARAIMEATERCLADPSDYQGRATFMWAATLAWNGLGTAGVAGAGVPNHMLAHPLGALYDLPHGATLSIVIPAWMRYTAGAEQERFARFGENVFGARGGGAAQEASRGIDLLEAWFKKIGSPVTFAQGRVPAEELDRIADRAVELARVWGMSAYTKSRILEIYKLCL